MFRTLVVEENDAYVAFSLKRRRECCEQDSKQRCEVANNVKDKRFRDSHVMTSAGKPISATVQQLRLYINLRSQSGQQLCTIWQGETSRCCCSTAT